MQNEICLTTASITFATAYFQGLEGGTNSYATLTATATVQQFRLQQSATALQQSATALAIVEAISELSAA